MESRYLRQKASAKQMLTNSDLVWLLTKAAAWEWLKKKKEKERESKKNDNNK